MNYSKSSSADTFNARHKTPSEVAMDFIPPPGFNSLLEFNNCILIGPRGSGKTTLLKMLQLSALLSWCKSESIDHSSFIKFIGVFVAADVRWAKQLELVTKGIPDPQQRTAIHEAAFSNFVSLSLIESLQKSLAIGVLRPFGQAAENLDRKVESDLSKKLSDIWKIQAAPSLSALKHLLRVQQADIPKVSSEISKQNPSLTEEAFPFIGLSWLNSLTLAIETINDHLGIEDQKWALLVDELEIIPPDLLERILYPLRSVSSNLVFKFAISPTGAGSDILSKHEENDATQDNDFSIISLWNTKKEDTRLFSSQLLIQALKKRGAVEEADISLLPNVLGWSGMAEDDDDCISGTDTSRVTLEQRKKIFLELSKKDPSFNNIITEKGIDIEDMTTSDKLYGGTLVRKITPLVYLRNHVIKHWSPQRVEYRGKKSFQPYYRYPNILDLTEGNPRWVLNLSDYLAMGANKKSQNINSQSVQTDAINSFKDRFISMLTVYPVSTSVHDGALTPYAFLCLLGEHIKENIYKNEFSSDPALSFVVDKKSASEYGDLISICIHLGALVLVDNDASKKPALITGQSGLEGRVVRLCYRLSPEFFLPLRAGRAVKMYSALERKDKITTPTPLNMGPQKHAKPKKSLEKKDQMDLF